MNIAAGVLLIILAVLDLIAGLSYIGGGAAASAVSGMGSDFARAAAQAGNADKAALDSLAGASSAGFLYGARLQAYGVFVLVVAGLLIASAVFLFQNNKPKFILICCALAILVEIVGIVSWSHLGITNIAGLACAAFGIVGALTISKSQPVTG